MHMEHDFFGENPEWPPEAIKKLQHTKNSTYFPL